MHLLESPTGWSNLPERESDLWILGIPRMKPRASISGAGAFAEFDRLPVPQFAADAPKRVISGCVYGATLTSDSSDLVKLPTLLFFNYTDLGSRVVQV